MSSLGRDVIRHLLADPHDRYLLFDPHGWLQDVSFASAANEFGIHLVTAGPFTPAETKRVEDALAGVPRTPSSQVAVVVSDDSALDQWARFLGDSWRIHDVQAVSVLPGLDPALTGTLSLADLERLLPKYGGERHAPRSRRATAWALLEELYGVSRNRIATAEGLLDEAYRLHAVGRPPPQSWVQAVKGDLPTVSGLDLDAEACLYSLPALVAAIRAGVRDGTLNAALWDARSTFLEAEAAFPSPPQPRTASWLPSYDVEALVEEARRQPWSELSLVAWLEQAPLLSKLALTREHEGKAEIIEICDRIEEAFAERLRREYLTLPSIPWLPKPPMVHQVPQYAAARFPEDRTAIFVIDCLSIPLWTALAHALASHGYRPTAQGATFAWIPTLTTVSRQALLSGKVPQDFEKHIGTTGREETAWREFWTRRGTPDHEIGFLKGADTRTADCIAMSRDADLSRVALIYNGIDELTHATAQAPALDWSDVARIVVEKWSETSLLPTFRSFLDEGWVVFVTSDHGAHRVSHDLGNPREGVRTENRGQRARIYSRETFLKETSLPGEHWDGGAFLPTSYSVLLAPSRAGYGLARGWSHGGASWEEVLVPLVRFGGRTG